MVEVLFVGGPDGAGRDHARADLEVPARIRTRALLLVRLVREMGTLAAALGIGLSDRAILPTASLCAGSESEAVAIITAPARSTASTRPQHRMSALQDIEAGRPLEVNETLGYALDKARDARARAAAAGVLPAADRAPSTARAASVGVEPRPA